MRKNLMYYIMELVSLGYRTPPQIYNRLNKNYNRVTLDNVNIAIKKLLEEGLVTSKTGVNGGLEL